MEENKKWIYPKSSEFPKAILFVGHHPTNALTLQMVPSFWVLMVGGLGRPHPSHCKIKGDMHIMPLINMEGLTSVAGVAGFEPANTGFKVPRLTAWLHPNKVDFYLCTDGKSIKTTPRLLI